MSGIRRTTRKEPIYGEQGLRLLSLSKTVETDPFFSDVTILLPMEGVDNGTTFTDLSPVGKTWTRNGTPVTVTGFSPNGVSSGAFLSDGNYISTTTTSAITFGSADFCVEAWIYPLTPATGTERCIMGLWSATNPGAQAWWLYLGSGNLRFMSDLIANDNLIFNVSGVITNERWYHVRVDRSGAALNMFVDGAVVATYDCGTSAITTGSNTFGVGGYNRGTGGTSPFLGYIGPVRVTKRSRGTASFAPQTRYPTR